MNHAGLSTCCCCFAQVEQGNVAIMENLGRFVDVFPPGCHCVSCTGEIKGTLSLKARYLPAEVRSITSDQADVICNIGIMYRVMPENCHLAFYRLSNPAEQIRTFVVGSVRPLLITRTLDALFLERDELSIITRNELGQRMAEFGYEIIDVLFENLRVEGRVRESMNQQMTQKYNRQLQEVQQRTSNIRQIAISNVNVEVERLEGVGTAEARKVLAAAFTASEAVGMYANTTKDAHGTTTGNKASTVISINDPNDGVTSQTELMSMMLMMQYYDMLRDVRKTLTYFMPLGAGSDTAAGDAKARSVVGKREMR